MNLRWLDWIWHIRGSVPLEPGQSSDDAFDKLAPLFRQYGTTHERHDDVLTFRKKDQAAQDKMSVFDGGTLRVEGSSQESVLRYHLISRALLFCFLAPLLFVFFAQLTVLAGKLPGADAGAKKPDKVAALPLNPIDKFLGAPAPEKPKKKDKGDDHKKPSPTPAYVFAGLFAFLYLVGRILEDRLVKSLFRKALRSA